MAERQVAVSVLQLRHADDIVRWVRAGDIVDVDGEDLERGDRLGFLAPVPDPDFAADVDLAYDNFDPLKAAEAEPAGPVDEPERPPRAASKDLWVEYAVAKGVDRELAESSTKAELVAEFD